MIQDDDNHDDNELIYQKMYQTLDDRNNNEAGMKCCFVL